MDWLEEELKTALARKAPSADFAGRVLRQAAGGSGRAPAHQWHRWLAAAAALVLIAGGGLGYRQHRGEVAKEQVMQALRIASVKVNRIQAQMREAGR